jgi:hypothetical protein
MNLCPVIVKNKTFCTLAGHVKVMFSLLLERISKKYESFKCFFTWCWVLPLVEPYN